MERMAAGSAVGAASEPSSSQGDRRPGREIGIVCLTLKDLPIAHSPQIGRAFPEES
jgi:hypothetical protein